MTKRSLTHILGIYLLLLIVIPKSFSSLFGVIPVRVLLSGLFVLINLIYKIKNKEFGFKGKKYIILGIIFLLTTIPSFFVTKNILTSAYTFIKFMVAFMVFEIIYNSKLNKDDIKLLFKYLLGSLIVVLLYALIQYIFRVNLFTIGAYNYPGARGRVSSTFFNTIYFAIFLNMIISLLSFYISKLNDKKLKALYTAILVISYICLLLTFTRSAIMIFVGCLIITLIINHKVIINKLLLPVYVLMILLSLLIPGVKSLYVKTYDDVKFLVSDKLLVMFLPGLDDEQITKSSEIINYTEDASLNSRIEFSKIGNRLGKDHMFTGIGFGAYEDYVYSEEYETNYPNFANYKVFPHSTLVLLYAEVSVLSIAAFMAIALLLVIDLLKIWFKNKNGDIRGLTALALTIIVGFVVVNVIAENAVYDSQVFPVFLIVIGSIISYINEVKLCQKQK